jgi:hypothetical protein
MPMSVSAGSRMSICEMCLATTDAVPLVSTTSAGPPTISGQIVRGRAVVRCGMPVEDEAVAREHAKVGSGIADVDCEEHGPQRPSFVMARLSQ